MTTDAFDMPSNRSGLIIIVNVILAASTLVSVIVRFVRPGKQTQLDAQGLMLCMAAFCGVMMSILQCIGTRYGLGAHASTLPTSEMEKFLKIYIFIMCFYMACNMFVKFALLFFYKNLAFERYHFWLVWTMEFVAFGFGVSSILVVVFQCVPITKLWHPDQSGSCIDLLAFLYSNAFIMIVNDIILYILPVIFTRKLHLRRPQRVVLNLLFALGALVVGTSFVRLWVVYRYGKEGDITWNMANCLLWSAVENHIAIFITCAPSIKALVAGTLVPLVTNSYETIREKMKRSSGSDSNTTGLSSIGSTHAPNNTPIATIGSTPSRRVHNMLDSFRSRSHSVASEDSGFDQIMRNDSAWERKGSACSEATTYSKSSLKEPAVTVYAMDELSPSPPRLGHLPSCPDLEAQARTPSPKSHFDRD